MGMGCEVYNASGQLTFASGDYLPRVIGTFDTGIYDGSFGNGNLAGGTPFFIYFPLGQGNCPTVYISGTTVGWYFSGDGGDASKRCNGYVVYGLRT